jgi:hypothetical protein
LTLGSGSGLGLWARLARLPFLQPQATSLEGRGNRHLVEEAVRVRVGVRVGVRVRVMVRARARVRVRARARVRVRVRVRARVRVWVWARNRVTLSRKRPVSASVREVYGTYSS